MTTRTQPGALKNLTCVIITLALLGTILAFLIIISAEIPQKEEKKENISSIVSVSHFQRMRQYPAMAIPDPENDPENRRGPWSPGRGGTQRAIAELLKCLVRGC